MNKFLIALLFLLSLACVSVRLSDIDTGTYCLPVESQWNLYVFDIDNGPYIGRAFIADYGIWSAKHIFQEQDPGVSDDVKFLGPTEVKGLTICRQEHALKDVLYYRTQRGIVYLVITFNNENMYETLSLNQLKHGDSGSPVMCLKDGEVVGVVSHLTVNLNRDCIGGSIARIKLAKIEDK